MRRLFVIATLLLSMASPAWAVFPTVSLRDDFNRANEGPPPSSSWVTSNGTGVSVASNIARGSGAGFDAATWNTSFGPDMEAELEIAQVPTDGVYHELTLRQQTNTSYDSNHYEIDIIPVAGANNDTIEIWKEISTVFTQLGATINLAADFAAGNKWGGSVISTTLTAYFNGTSIGTRTDSDVSGAGYAGFLLTDTTVDLYVDNFYAGTVSSGGTTGPPMLRLNLGGGK